MKIRVTGTASFECEVDDKFQALAEDFSSALEEELVNTLATTVPNSVVKVDIDDLDCVETADGILLCEW